MAENREARQERTMKRVFLLINCIILATGNTGGPLLMRLYYIHGGNRVWLSSFLQTVGFPIMLLHLSISYIRRRCIPTAVDSTKPKVVSIKPLSFVAAAVIGVLIGLSNYLYSYGVARLPLSTSALILGTQLAFIAIFAFLLVRQKFTSYSVNAIVLLLLGAGVMALHGSGDRPAGESTKQYVMGFVMTLVSTLLNAFIMPLMELVYKKTKQTLTYSLALEIQLVVCLFSTLFSVVGMIIDNDFKIIPTEARHFGLGEVNYYVLLVGIAIIWQAYFFGAMGVIFCASSLLFGVMIAMLMPVTEVLAIIFFKEKFQAEKGVSLVLSLWGFVSYFYGEFKQAKKMKKNCIPKTQLLQNHSIPNP